jgi:hypothetical protein
LNVVSVRGPIAAAEGLAAPLARVEVLAGTVVADAVPLVAVRVAGATVDAVLAAAAVLAVGAAEAAAEGAALGGVVVAAVPPQAASKASAPRATPPVIIRRRVRGTS